ncbi:ABC transporter permease [Rhodococcus sp. 7Tela_A2]|uniref:ABC transporter permease n=1 Tax=Rhodococcus sp. 7Tela_A2 TaxID=3093744 RepID=UPI003BB586E5
MSHLTADTPARDADPSTVVNKRTPHSAFMLLGMTAGLGVILVLLLMVFIMPSLKSGAHDLSVGLAGTSGVVDDFEQALVTAAPDAYTPQRYDSEQDLRDAILDREIVGGFVVEESGVHALVASAGSATISGTLAGTANAVGQVTASPVTVEDVVPLPASDPTGVGIGGLAFPLVFGGIVPVVAFRKILPRSNGWYLAGLFTFAAVGGTIVAAVLTYAFGSVDTGFGAVAGSIAMGIAALAFPLAGLQKLFGAKGFTIGAMAMMFLGNPLAGISTTSAWLPSGLGTFGQILPPGAAGTLVRSAAYFQGTGGLVAACTLAAWIVVGLALYVIGMRRTRVDAPVAASAVPAA